MTPPAGVNAYLPAGNALPVRGPTYSLVAHLLFAVLVCAHKQRPPDIAAASPSPWEGVPTLVMATATFGVAVLVGIPCITVQL